MYWIVLIVGAVLTLAYVISKIRSKQITTSDAVFWFVLSFCLVLLALIPNIVFFMSNVLGFVSPANFIFLCVLVVLIYHQLTMSVKLCRLQATVTQLTQVIALSGIDKKEAALEAEQVTADSGEAE